VTVGLAPLLTWFDLKLTCGFEEVFKIGFKLACDERTRAI
jgi:hypothetical protein